MVFLIGGCTTYHIDPLRTQIAISCVELHCHSKHPPCWVRGSPHSPHCYCPWWSLQKTPITALKSESLARTHTHAFLPRSLVLRGGGQRGNKAAVLTLESLRVKQQCWHVLQWKICFASTFFFFTKLHKAFRIKHCGCKLQQGKTHGINSTSISGPGGWDASFPMWKPSLTNGWDGPLLTGAADVTQPPSRVLRMIHTSMRWRVSNDLYCGEKQETRGQRSAPQGFLIKADI